MDVSLTTFIDFTNANGPTRTTIVRKAKIQTAEYEPAADFYRGIRNAIIKDLSEDSGYTSVTQAVSDAHPRRYSNYNECAEGFKRWVRGKDMSWIGRPEPALWPSGGLQVRVNPEIMVEINGKVFAIKMYFKAPKLVKRRSDAMLHLLETVPVGSTVDTVGVLDVRRGRLFTPPTRTPNLDAYLASEAAAFATMWNLLP